MEKEAGLRWKEVVFVGCLLIKFRKRAVGKLWRISLSGGAERVGWRRGEGPLWLAAIS